MTRTYRSKIAASVHEPMEGLSDAGIIDLVALNINHLRPQLKIVFL